jgi:hypothetical protein
MTEERAPTGEWRLLLRLLLGTEAGLNAIESALTSARILTRAQNKEIRQQASDTAGAWSAREDDDVLRLLAAHSSPDATMLVPPVVEG